MAVKWKVLITKVAIWMFFELLLTLLGLDDLADYSEFVFPVPAMSFTAIASP
jgi:hypothetical protein